MWQAPICMVNAKKCTVFLFHAFLGTYHLDLHGKINIFLLCIDITVSNTLPKTAPFRKGRTAEKCLGF